VASSQNPAEAGAEVTFTATVSAVAPASGSPSGTVQFFSNAVPIGAAAPLVGGSASVSTVLPSGTNTITVAYLGDGNFTASTNELLQVVATLATAPTALGIIKNLDGSVTVTFAGTPGARYVIQATPTLNPAAWSDVSTNTAGEDGHWALTEPMNAPQRFYRSVAP
ncbi:MAG TPA: Ig-like domain-containing protein, partial [Verrucomicrobiae bacterium]|nr:Ig-like domain-containing protein [Verrucomicrobiae bacterium]